MSNAVFLHDVTEEKRRIARKEQSFQLFGLPPEMCTTLSNLDYIFGDLEVAVRFAEDEKSTDDRVRAFLANFNAAELKTFPQIWRYLEQRTAPFPCPVPVDPVTYMKRADAFPHGAVYGFLLSVAYQRDEWIVQEKNGKVRILHAALSVGLPTPRVLGRFIRFDANVIVSFMSWHNGEGKMFEFDVRHRMVTSPFYYGIRDPTGVLRVLRETAFPNYPVSTDHSAALLLLLFFRFMLQYYDSYYFLHHFKPTHQFYGKLGRRLFLPERLSNDFPFIPPLMNNIDISLFELADKHAKSL